MNKKINIYVASHKETTFPNNSIYIPIRVGASINNEDFGYLRDDKGENISNKNKNYCELTAIYWIWKNDKSDIVGLTHYRRYFFKRFKGCKFANVLDENDIEKLLVNNDIILPNRTFIIKHNVKTSWEYSHHLKDYEKCRAIIERKYPEYLDDFDKFSKSKLMYTCNMCITKKKVFDDYCNWLFDILFELEKEIDLSNYDDYNKRLYGFLSERLLNVWTIHNKNLKIKRIPVYNMARKPHNQYLMIN